LGVEGLIYLEGEGFEHGADDGESGEYIAGAVSVRTN